MTEVGYDIMTAWYQALTGISVDVYKESVDPAETGDYVLLRLESETTIPNNSAFLKNPVLIVEAVTFHQNAINPSTAWDIMNEIVAAVFNTPGDHNISMSKLYGIEDSGTITVQEEESTPRVYRVIKRFLNQTIQ